jgi:SWI/SNF-related matrix-associated actin-dependent regulator 1 of chromatin subfamily A
MPTNEPLYPYQQAVLGQMKAGAPIYLGFDPGLGKSRTALEAAKERGAGRVLIISPASGRYVWERECARWYPRMPFLMVNGPNDFSKLRAGRGLILITYGLLSQKDSAYANVIAKGPAFDMTIIDEASAVKNSSANRTKAILGKMWPRLGYVVPMSGTPAPNHAGELFPILAAHFPQSITTKINGTVRPMKEYEFQDVYCKIVNKSFGGGRQVRVIEGSKNVPVLRHRINGYMQRVKKETVLADLPPIRWDVVPVQPDPGLVDQLVRVPEGLSDDDLLKWLSGADGEHVQRLRHILGVAKVKASVEYIDDFMTNLPSGQKLLVFAHHREVIAHLMTGLADWSPVAVTGGSSTAERALAIDQFLNVGRHRIFVGNIQAAGTALTLVGPKCRCSDVIFVEATYSVGDNVQAACRVHRIGQHDAVVARMLTAHGTIDDRIQDILSRKAADFASLFN